MNAVANNKSKKMEKLTEQLKEIGYKYQTNRKGTVCYVGAGNTDSWRALTMEARKHGIYVYGILRNDFVLDPVSTNAMEDINYLNWVLRCQYISGARASLGALVLNPLTGQIYYEQIYHMRRGVGTKSTKRMMSEAISAMDMADDRIFGRRDEEDRTQSKMKRVYECVHAMYPEEFDEE